MEAASAKLKTMDSSNSQTKEKPKKDPTTEKVKTLAPKNQQMKEGKLLQERVAKMTPRERRAWEVSLLSHQSDPTKAAGEVDYINGMYRQALANKWL
ncbi:MAG: hypothetical protein S4CHLAM20_08980 [Chlamydiia bacterium]|nr:hypothetical protein [Chlamydiia bacterium]